MKWPKDCPTDWPFPMWQGKKLPRRKPEPPPFEEAPF